MTRAAFSGALWTASGWGISALSQLVFGILLARILGPQVIGIFAAALVIVRFPAIANNLGAAQALVQKPELEERDTRTALLLSLTLAVAIGALTWLAAPWVADFYRMPEVGGALRLLALVFPLRGLAVVPRALLQRNLRYRELAAISAAAYLLGYGIPGLSLALAGLGLEALIVATLGQALIELVLLTIVQPYPKKPALSRESLQEILRFGGGVTLGNLFSVIAFQADRLITGRLLGAEALGLYSRSYSLMATSTKLYSNVGSTILFPLLARAQENSDKVRRALLNGLALNGLFALPLSVVLFVAAPELITTLLGASWKGAIQPFRVLVLVLAFRGADKLSGPILMALGKVYRLAVVQALFALSVVTGAWLGATLGVVGVAMGVGAATIIHSLLLLQQAAGLTQSRGGELLASMLRPAAAATGTLVVAFGLRVLCLRLGLPDPIVAAASTIVPIGLLALTVLAAPTAALSDDVLLTLRQIPLFRRIEDLSAGRSSRPAPAPQPPESDPR